jgi:hypothetical protein
MKYLVIICVLTFLSLNSIAQCDKNVVYISGEADFVDSAGNVLRSKQGKITARFSKTEFVLVHDDDEDDALRGDVKNLSCEWEVPFQNGNTIFESDLIEKSGEKNSGMVSIEGKDGKLLIMINFRSRGMIIKIVPESYTEME